MRRRISRWRRPEAGGPAARALQGGHSHAIPALWTLALTGVLMAGAPDLAGAAMPPSSAPEHNVADAQAAGIQTRDIQSGVIEEDWALNGLLGTLSRPSIRPGAQDHPRCAVLLIAGSGPTDRDGNGPQLATNLYRQIAHALSARGHVVLRYDKRGIGASAASAPREEDLRFEDYAEDARAASAALARRPDVDGVVLAGHSEGGLVALQALDRENQPKDGRPEAVRGVILLATPGRPFGDILREQLQGALPPDLSTEANTAINALEQGRTIEAPTALAALFRPSVQPYLISLMALDPAQMLARQPRPVLLMQGGRDLQVSMADLQRLAAARPDAGQAVLEQANHIFKDAPEDRAGNLALYAQPQAPLSPGLAPRLADFLESTCSARP